MSNLNDAKGKLNEILLSMHISVSGEYPHHFRGLEMCPESIHDTLKEFVDLDLYNDIYQDTMEMSTQIKAVLNFDGLMANTTDVQSVTWTSNPDTDNTPGDHEKLIGVKDINSDADIIIHTISGNYIGISAKYGTSKNITLRGPGAASMEELTGAKGLNSKWNEHVTRMIELGFKGTQSEMHLQFKECKINNPTLAKKATQSSLSARHDMMELIRQALSKKTSDELRDIIVAISAPKTYIPHYRTQTRPHKSGTQHHVHQIDEHTKTCINNYSSFDVDTEGTKSMSLGIYGYLVDNGKRERVSSISIKGRNGPMKGWNGNFTAPLLSKDF